jgi:mono/diheme cytochrome c family protein
MRVYVVRFLPFLTGLVLIGTAFACSNERPDRQPLEDPVLQRGVQLYNAHCLGCHGGATGGTMMDIPPPHNARGHTWHHPDCQLRDIIRNGSGAMGEVMRRMMNVPESVPRMPAFRDTLNEEDIAAILAYIKTWWTEEQRRTQRQITETHCS